jgi:O-antigen biosynthesis protein
MCLYFYKAMIIFAKKHFSQKNARIFSFLIHLAIYFRAFLSIIKRFLDKIYQPAIDAFLISVGYILIANLLEKFRYEASNYFPATYFKLIIPLYVMVWIASFFLSAGYKKPIRIWNMLNGYLIGFLIIVIIYALLPENFRYSRLIIILGAMWTGFALTGHRMFFSFLNRKDYELSISRQKKIIVIGTEEESLKVLVLLREIETDVDFIGFISDEGGMSDSYIGKTEKLREAININKPDEIIFCSSDISSRDIIKHISLLSDLPVDFKIASAGSYAIIGSNSVRTPGDMFLVSFDSIGSSKNKRNKRLFDLAASMVLVLGFPIFIFILPHYPAKLLLSIKVLFGKYTWIGYDPNVDLNSFPVLKKSIYTISNPASLTKDKKNANIMNTEYVRDYTIQKDMGLLWRNLISKE